MAILPGQSLFNRIVLKGTKNYRERRRVKIDIFLRSPLLKRYVNSDSKLFFPILGPIHFVLGTASSSQVKWVLTTAWLWNYCKNSLYNEEITGIETFIRVPAGRRSQ